MSMRFFVILLATACTAPLHPSVTKEEAISACLTIGSCLDPGGGVNFCLLGNDGLRIYRPDEIRCLAAAGSDCAKAAACASKRIAPTTSGCTPPESCDGNFAVSCDDGLVREESDCARWGAGGTCMQGTGGAACAIGSCSTSTASCNGAVAVSCNTRRGLLEAVDCGALLGLACTLEGSGQAGCIGTGDSCVTDTCDGSELVACYGGRSQRIQCGGVIANERCIPNAPNTNFATCGFSNQCETAAWGESCDGSVLTFCAAGEPRSVDCAALGYAGCGRYGCTPTQL